MEKVYAELIVENLIPKLSDKEKKEMQLYHRISEKYNDEINLEATKELFDHPIFGEMIKNMPKEIADERNRLSQKLQKEAIYEDNWLPYIEDLIGQGVMYAKMNMSFSSWFEIVALVRKYFIPYLQKDYGNGDEFLAAMNGMNILMDSGMSIIGEAYLHEKSIIINEANQKMSSIYDATADAIFVIDCEDEESFKFISVNNSYLSITGFKSEEVIGKYICQFLDKNSLSSTFVKFNEAITKKSTVRWEEQNIYPNGELTFEVNVVPIFDKEEKTVRLVGAFHDITQRKKAEEEILKLNKELESFTYTVAHDLRAPLRAINGFSQILIEDCAPKLDENDKRLVDTICQNSKKMGLLIDDLLSFSKLGRKEIEKSKVNLETIFKEVEEELKTTFPNEVMFKFESLPEVQADYILLKQVVYNLLSNAVKYSSKSKQPIIEVTCKKINNKNVISIKDNGVGFDMKYSDKLFGIFQRLHLEEDFEGTGVGLAIVHKIISKHGGKIWAESTVDNGATFHFTLN